VAFAKWSLTIFAVVVLVVLFMQFFAPFRRSAATGGGSNMTMKRATLNAAASSSSSSSSAAELPPFDVVAVQAVVSAALWSFFAGDAVASPTHWFYGGFRQVQQYYDPVAGITGYTKPVVQLAGSILNRSNLSGGGRSSSGSSTTREKTIIGHVINHGKQDWWSPSKSIHYHATLQAGETTLEASLGRVLLQSLAANEGRWNAEHFRTAYVTFMTTPHSHNDTYASTCHRMFFANWYYKHMPPVDCPDNDRHNVDTIDGLVLPTITALAVALQHDGTAVQAARQAAETVAVTRNSAVLQRYAAEWATLVFETVRLSAAASSTGSHTDMAAAAPVKPLILPVLVQTMARNLALRTPQIRPSDEITACYLESAVPAMLDTLLKYNPERRTESKSEETAYLSSVWTGLLANANTGGENVHRGSCMGAVWGAVSMAHSTASSTSSNALAASKASPLVDGLYHRAELQREIEALLTGGLRP
jgi:ADP-ribosyl-[dinitrogen reductase] hydrolase